MTLKHTQREAPAMKALEALWFMSTVEDCESHRKGGIPFRTKLVTVPLSPRDTEKS